MTATVTPLARRAIDRMPDPAKALADVLRAAECAECTIVLTTKARAVGLLYVVTDASGVTQISSYEEQRGGAINLTLVNGKQHKRRKAA